MADTVSLTVGGMNYTGWNKIRVTRGIERCTADFEIEVTEKWADSNSPLPWQIKPFMPCTLAIGGDLVLTGYVDNYEPSYSATEHTVKVGGRSKTCDVVDCVPDVGSGQFSGYTVAQIATALCSPFGVSVVVGAGANVGTTIPDATHEKTETAYALIEKLCRLHALLAFDNANGNLVIATVGSGGAAGALVEGSNILAAGAKLSGAQRFQKYVVLAQAPELWNGGGAAQTQVEGSATDAGVPRYRRHAEMAESAGVISDAQLRATWRAKRNFGRGTEATITVQGFRQAGGALWGVNETVLVNSPRLELNRSLLIAKVEYLLDDKSGSRTQLTVAPQEAYTPEPLTVKAGASNAIWSGQ